MTCPTESFPTVAAAEQALIERRARATLNGSPQQHQRVAFPCDRCGMVHIVRADDAPIERTG